MLADMRPDELGMWVAYYGLEPWDEQRADLRAALVATEVHRAMGSKRSDRKPIVMADFRLYEPEEKPEVSPLSFMRQRLGHMVVKKKVK
jgi:hypothetical protein